METRKARLNELELDLLLALVFAAGVMLLGVRADRAIALLLPVPPLMLLQSVPARWLLAAGDLLVGMDLVGALLYIRDTGRLSRFGQSLYRVGFFLTWLGLLAYLWDRTILREYQLLQVYRYPAEMTAVAVVTAAALIFFSRPFWRLGWPNQWADWLIRLYLAVDPSGRIYSLLRSLVRAKHMSDRYITMVYALATQMENGAANTFDTLECEIRRRKPAAPPERRDLRDLLHMTRLREALADHIAPAYLAPRLSAERRLAAGALYDANHLAALRLSRMVPAQKWIKRSPGLALACYQGLEHLPPAQQAFVYDRAARLSGQGSASRRARAFFDGSLPGPEPEQPGGASAAGQVIQRLIAVDRLAVLALSAAAEDIRATGDLAAVLETCLGLVDRAHAPGEPGQAAAHILGYAWWDLALQIRAAANKTGYPAAAWQNAVNCFTLARRPIPLEHMTQFAEETG